MKIFYTSRFEKSYRKLPKNLKAKAEEKEKIFRKNPFDRRLDTHKSRGKLKGLSSFSINDDYRIVFEIDKKSGKIYFHQVGNHDIYK